LRDCAPEARVIFGGARISLASQPDGTHDLIILDAFSSDAIPLHLLTREAVDLYLRKLSPRGVLAFHITNRYFGLLPCYHAWRAMHIWWLTFNQISM
jgi:spermidine synthase